MTKRQIKHLTVGTWFLCAIVALIIGSPVTRARVEAEDGTGLSAITDSSPTGESASSTQEKPAQPQEKHAEEPYKNIQIFKGLPAAGVMRAMAFFTRSLGVECTHCHVAGEFEKDDKPAKQTARKMYQMVQLSNKVLGTNRVSCYACHRGHVQPELPPDSWKAEMEAMQKKSEQDQRPAEQVYKNVQTLKGLPAGRWMMIMTMFTKSLGVDCTHCHVPGEFDKDDKPAKQTARKMLGLTGAISREIYKGPTSINCYTCHKGQPQPVSFPPANQPASSGPKPAEMKPPEITRSDPMPTVDQVLDNYTRAIGGANAFAKLKTRVLKGSLVAEGGLNAPLEIYAKTPGKLLMVMNTPGAPATVAFNGTTAWQKNQSGVRDMTGAEAEFIKRQAHSFAGVGIRDIYTKLEIIGKATVGQRETFVIDAALAEKTERLYFDAQTGLLLRQEVDGVKLPFARRWSRPDFTFTQKFEEIKHNVTIDDVRFEKPIP